MSGATTSTMIGRILTGRYRVVALMATGIYRAEQLSVGREVAVKVFDARLAFDEESRGRFVREAQSHGLLASPHTVNLIDFGMTEEGEPFLVMELLVGESVRARLARLGRFPIEIAIDVCVSTLRSLAEAHAKGMVHRELKPEHLLFARVAGVNGEEEILKVIDFGIAKRVDESAPNTVETQAGVIVGTPHYMSPEQARGTALDARSDLYSLGVVLYEMLTGRPPFDGDSPFVVMAQHSRREPTPPSRACVEAALPAELDALVLRILAKDPAARPQSAQAMTDELLAVRDARPHPRPSTRDSIGDTAPDLHALRQRASDMRRWRARAAAAASGLIIVGAIVAGVAIGRARGRIARVATPTATAPTSAPTAAPVTPDSLPSAPASSPPGDEIAIPVESLRDAPPDLQSKDRRGAPPAKRPLLRARGALP
jgi:serine/threonine-protein kinase